MKAGDFHRAAPEEDPDFWNVAVVPSPDFWAGREDWDENALLLQQEEWD